MILELQANSALNQGYAPNWIRIEAYDATTQEMHELTMDIMGETNYEPNTLQTRTKGWLMPWTYQNGNELLDLEDLPKEYFPTYTQSFEDMLWDKGAVVIGIYPTNDKNYQENDILTNGIGRYTNNNGLSIEFKFECELNL